MKDARYDYKNQAWTLDGRYERCGHPQHCTCYGRLHAGEPVSGDVRVDWMREDMGATRYATRSV